MKAKQNLNPDPKVIKGLLDLNKSRDYSLLEKELTSQLKEFQGSPFLHNLMGLNLVNQGRLEKSLDSFNLAIKYSEDKSTYLNNLGITFLKLGRFTKAISIFNQSIDFDNLNVNAHFYLGNALKRSGRIDEAIISYDAVLNLDPDHSEALLLKSLSLKNLGRLLTK